MSRNTHTHTHAHIEWLLISTVRLWNLKASFSSIFLIELTLSPNKLFYPFFFCKFIDQFLMSLEKIYCKERTGVGVVAIYVKLGTEKTKITYKLVKKSVVCLAGQYLISRKENKGLRVARTIDCILLSSGILIG